MRILMVHTYYADRGGEDLVFETESKLLRQAGHDICTLTFNNKTQKLLKFLLYPFNLFSFIRTCYTLWMCKPDVVHFHNWHFSASVSSLLACRLFQKPIVQTLHNYRLICPTGTLFHKRSIYLRSLQPEEWNAPVKDKVYRDSSFQTFWVWMVAKIFKYLRLYKLIKRYIVLTPSAKEIFLETHFKNVAEKFVVKSNFLEKKELTEQERKPFFLFVGRLTYDKGIKVLLNAFKDLPYEVKIVGDGPLKEDVIKVASQHANIIYLGFQQFPQIQQLMRECNAIIFPSVSYEGMPMTILEAYANGCAVIASDFSAMQTMVTHGVTGYHFPMGNIESLKTILHHFDSLPIEAKRQISKNARSEYEKKYTPEVNLEKLITIYKESLTA